MFAQLLVDLAFRAVVRIDDVFTLIEVERGGYLFRIHPPYKSSITAADRDFAEGRPLVEVTDRLMPANPQPTPVLLDDGPAVVADALQIDILGPLTRDPEGEPAIPIAFDVANRLLERLRVVAQAWTVRPLSENEAIWQLRYVEDDGSELAPEPPLVRGRMTSRFHVPAMPPIRPDGLWAAIRELREDFTVPPWETLLLDAFGLLPEPGPAIVLATSAIETRIDDALQLLADRHGGSVAQLWSWLTGRDRWWQEPSLVDRLSVTLAALGGRPLTEESHLWEAFQNLRRARNSYVHDGVARIGDRAISSQDASSLLVRARQLIDWLEEQLPEEARRPRYLRQHRFQTTHPVTLPRQ